jgi:hypothetical protein
MVKNYNRNTILTIYPNSHDLYLDKQDLRRKEWHLHSYSGDQDDVLSFVNVPELLSRPTLQI